MSSQKSSWLHIPMEIIDRELYPKLLLAAEALEQGWQCTIGTKRALVKAADTLPSGIVYLKSVIPSEIENMRTFKKHGHRLVSLDEEGLVQNSLDSLATLRYCAETVAETEKFFCWGEIQSQALQRHYKSDAHKFTATGSPTADLWIHKAKDMFSLQVADLRARFGRYILVPSSFGVPNHFMGPIAALEIMERDNMFRTKADYDEYMAYHDYTADVFEQFLKLIPVIATEFPDHTIIVRPHPSENHDTWKKAAEDYSNVRVLFEGAVTPWLLGADAILHWGSTTGIEAHLMGRPVVGYTPYPEREKSYDTLPHRVSILAHTKEDVLKIMHDLINTPANWISRYPAIAEGHAYLRQWIHNIDQTHATTNIMRILKGMNVEEKSFDARMMKERAEFSFKHFVWNLLEILWRIDFIRKILPERIQIGIKSRAYGRRKIKPLLEKDVQTGIDLIYAGKCNVKKIAEELFVIIKP